VTMAEEQQDLSDSEKAPPPKKRSLFTKSMFNHKATQHKEGIDFFSRASELYPLRLAEEERKRQKRLKKLALKRTAIGAETKSSSPDGKRKRASQNEDEDGHFSDSPLDLTQQDDKGHVER
jgi:hypothetical protein